jgi:hypothetical protein
VAHLEVAATGSTEQAVRQVLAALGK